MHARRYGHPALARSFETGSSAWVASRLWASTHIILSTALLGNAIAVLDALRDERKKELMRIEALNRKLDQRLLDNLNMRASALRPDVARDAEGLTELEFVIGMCVELDMLDMDQVCDFPPRPSHAARPLPMPPVTAVPSPPYLLLPWCTTRPSSRPLGCATWMDQVTPFINKFHELDIDGNGRLGMADLRKQAARTKTMSSVTDLLWKQAVTRQHGTNMTAGKLRKAHQQAASAGDAPRSLQRWQSAGHLAPQLETVSAAPAPAMAAIRRASFNASRAPSSAASKIRSIGGIAGRLTWGGADANAVPPAVRGFAPATSQRPWMTGDRVLPAGQIASHTRLPPDAGAPGSSKPPLDDEQMTTDDVTALEEGVAGPSAAEGPSVADGTVVREL